ncbi:MAG: type I 3-dehydroquinate dehydratase [Dehalococcoidia bacterium]|nr:type I 3-dehydroquinate dehydratase [Dehalococcoidia bacterium]
MLSPDICACITSASDMALAKAVHDRVALYEVRIDLIGDSWPDVVSGLPRPWIACNRLASQGGTCTSSENERLATLQRAIERGAAMVDIEMCAPDAVSFVRETQKSVRVIVSHHDFRHTAEEESLASIVRLQKSMGADVCKVVTTARRVEDAALVLRLARRFVGQGVLTFAMGPLGMVSRVLAPLAGAEFTYASLTVGHESAPGQLTVDALCDIYHAMGVI